MSEYARYAEFGSPRRSGKLGRTIDAVAQAVLGGKAVGLFGPAPVVGAIGSAVLGSSPEGRHLIAQQLPMWENRDGVLVEVPSFCEQGCYWNCEHRAPAPFLTRFAVPVPGDGDAAMRDAIEWGDQQVLGMLPRGGY